MYRRRPWLRLTKFLLKLDGKPRSMCILRERLSQSFTTVNFSNGVARKSWTRSGATSWLGSYFFTAGR